MKPLPLLCLMMLAACTPLGLYYKQGGEVSRMQSDLTDCKVSAVNRVPVNKEIDVLPGVLVPESQSCDAAGNCRIVPAHMLPGPVIVYDANEGLRSEVTRQCMTRQSYQFLTLPACPDGVARAAPPGVTRIMPPLSERSCAIHNRDGTWQIVTRG